MELWIRLLGAFVVTYVASRALFWLLGGRADRGVLPVLGVHLLCLGVLATAVAWIRSYFSTFAWEAAVPYIAPQAFWFIIDWLRIKR